MENDINTAILDLNIFKFKDMKSPKVEVETIISSLNNNVFNNKLKIEDFRRTKNAEIRYTDGNNALK